MTGSQVPRLERVPKRSALRAGQNCHAFGGTADQSSGSLPKAISNQQLRRPAESHHFKVTTVRCSRLCRCPNVVQVTPMHKHHARSAAHSSHLVRNSLGKRRSTRMALHASVGLTGEEGPPEGLIHDQCEGDQSEPARCCGPTSA